jgi:AcrR family transcriptional regulator
MGNREKLLAGAKRCMYEKGFARTTARDLVASSGTNLASIGYHFGSKEALLTEAMMEALGEWGAELEHMLSTDAEGGSFEQLEETWARLIESFATHRALWFATFDAFSEAERSPVLRQTLAEGYEHSRPWMASLFLKVDRSEVDERTARTVGSFLLALQAGLAAQWLLDPENSPSAADVAEGLRRIIAIVAATEHGDEDATRSDAASGSSADCRSAVLLSLPAAGRRSSSEGRGRSTPRDRRGSRAGSGRARGSRSRCTP